MEKKCLNCGKKLTNRQTKYCSNQCQKEYQYKKYIQDWKEGKETGIRGTGISQRIRRYMLEKNNYTCEICKWNKINPFTGNSPLEIHHIDGNYLNNNENNLQVLCPNCHSLTNTYKGMNKDSARNREQYLNRKTINKCIDCGKEIAQGSIRCRDCENLRRIKKEEDMPVTKEELKQLIYTMSFTQIGKKYNVSDNAIRKWCDKFNLPRTKKSIKTYSQEEWSLL